MFGLQDVKVWSSCIRAGVNEALRFSPVNNQPSEGDFVLFRPLHDDGLYNTIENVHGRNVRIYTGDLCVGVLGTRRSGTNANGVVPKEPLNRGGVLQLISAAGILGKAVQSADAAEKFPIDVRIEGFLLDPAGKLASLARVREIPPMRAIRPKTAARIVIVAGTSAEVGKTTFICAAIRALLTESPGLSIGAIKAVGTGRLRDLLAYQDAGAKKSLDFVGRGWPTTYGIPPSEFEPLFEALLTELQEESEIIFTEIGGDIVKGNSIAAINVAKSSRTVGVLCANDAMGALYGIQKFTGIGIPVAAIATFRQNLAGMSERIGETEVVNSRHATSMTRLSRILRG
jgi:hypothetical protein